jgi:hypothetical protein
MARNEIHEGDTGTVLEATVKDEDGAVVDISTATITNFLVRRPDNSLLTWSASFTTDGTDGKIQYTSASNTFNQDGNWRLQGRVAMPLWSGRTDWYEFTVYPNLD